MNNRDAPIGIFDSGVGGLTVFHAIRHRLPDENLIYLGDTARIPYGTRSVSTVQRYALEDVAFIQKAGVKLIVIACNTASALAEERLVRECSAPVVGVIKPGARRAVDLTKNGSIGVIATEATISSGAYEREIRAAADHLHVYSKACPLFVPLAEEGWAEHPVTSHVAEEYLADFRRRHIDTLVLGCTHYPILRATIERVMGNGLTYVDSGQAVAAEVAKALRERDLSATSGRAGTERFYVTDSPSRFRRVAELFLGRPIEHVEVVELGGA
jgi:glutamate racemase